MKKISFLHTKQNERIPTRSLSRITPLAVAEVLPEQLLQERRLVLSRKLLRPFAALESKHRRQVEVSYPRLVTIHLHFLDV